MILVLAMWNLSGDSWSCRSHPASHGRPTRSCPRGVSRSRHTDTHIRKCMNGRFSVQVQFKILKILIICDENGIFKQAP